MPGRLVGSVKFNSSIDGSRMPEQARADGEKAGAAGAKGFDKKWSEGIAKSVDETGKRNRSKWNVFGSRDGTTYGKSFNKTFSKMIDFENLRISIPDEFFGKLADEAGSTEGAIVRMRRSLDDLNTSTNISQASLQKASKELDDWARKNGLSTEQVMRNAAANEALDEKNRRLIDGFAKINAALDKTVADRDRVTRTSDRLRQSMDRLGGSLDKNGLKWRNLSTNTRQWTLIIAAVAAASENIAVLGSAAGAGLVALGGGVAALGVGALGAVAVFKNLNQDLKDAPAAMRPTIVAYRDMGKAFGALNDQIAMSAFAELDGTFARLTTTFRGLTPALSGLGTTIGRLGNDFSKAIEPGTEGFEQIQTLIRNSTPLFSDMARDAGTLGLALVRAFNRANPLVVDMVDWFGTLVDRFNTFTQSNGFDVWMSNASRVFGSFGKLLDATGRALNDLVTPDSVQRTTEFLDRLTSFMPNLEKMLSALGSIDVFGVLAAALDDLGKALAPMLPTLEELGAVIRNRLIVLLDAFGASLSIVAEVTTPLIQILTSLLKAIPAPVIQAAAVAVTALGVAFAGLKIAQSMDIAVLALQLGVLNIKDFITSAGGLKGAIVEIGGSVKSLPGKLAGVVGKAGVFGALAAAAVGAGFAISDLIDKIGGWSERAKESVAAGKGLLESVQAINPDFTYLGKTIDGTTVSSANLNAAMKLLADSGGTAWGVAMNNAAGATGDAKNAATDLASALGQMNKPLGDLASTNLPAAQAQFAKWTEGMNLSDGELYNLISGRLPEFKKALENNALSQGTLASKTDIVNAALGRQSEAQQSASAESDRNTAALDALQGKAVTATGEISGLADAIRGFSSKTLSARDASRNFEAAIDDATASVKENGNTLNINTAAGRANQAAIDNIAKAALNSAAAIYEQTGSQDKATGAIKKGRDALVEQLKQFGITGAKADAYIDQLGLIPSNISTYVKADTSKAESQINSFISNFSHRSVILGVGANLPRQPDMNASGTITNGPTLSWIGEAGPEAIVPLNRPLNQVDPSVRWLSAIAQNKSAPRLASGGVSGGGRTTNVEAGAIVVQGAEDPYRTANDVVRRLVELGTS